ncbi:MAG: DNA-binding protein [Synergistaceae bacterium]|nr:DNA-binding protein [Synergistaceae bacterium]
MGVQVLNWENSVRISGKVHFLRGQSEGESGTGKYVQFAIRQEHASEDGTTRRDFLIVRVYDESLRKLLLAKQEDDEVIVEGTLRSSRGSGVNYVRCASIE